MLLQKHTQRQELPDAPKGNTGASLPKPELKSHIDWLQGTFPESEFDRVMLVVSSALVQDVFIEQPYGTRFYERSWRSVTGALLARSPKLGGKVSCRTDAYLELSGSTLERIAPKRQKNLFESLLILGFRASRIDCTLDDYAKTFRPIDAYLVYRSGGVVGFRDTGLYMESGSPKEPAQTFSLGNRGKVGGGKFFQIYDKWLQSKGEKDCVRCEMSFYSEYASQVFEGIASALVDCWAEMIPAYIFGNVSFVEKVSKHVNRCPLATFWNTLKGAFQSLKLSRTSNVKTYEKAKSWFTKQVAPTLAMLCNAISSSEGTLSWDEFLCECLIYGEQRMNHSHHAILERVERTGV